MMISFKISMFSSRRASNSRNFPFVRVPKIQNPEIQNFPLRILPLKCLLSFKTLLLLRFKIDEINYFCLDFVRTLPLKMIDPQIDDLEFESDSDEVGSDLDMDQIPEDREQEDSDEVHSKRVFSLDD